MPDTTPPASSDEDVQRSQGDELSNLFNPGGKAGAKEGGEEESGREDSAAGDGEDTDAAAATGRSQGRPRKPKRERKTEVVKVYFDPVQLAKVEAKAEAAGRTRSDFIRRAALGQEITPKADAETRHQLQRAGVNLNQLAKVANATGEIEVEQQLEAVLDALRRAAQQIG